MRRRALLLACIVGALVGGLASASGAAIGTNGVPGRDSPRNATTLARGELADIVAPSALSRPRDQLGREHDVRGGVAAALGIALALTLTGGWWLARRRLARTLGPNRSNSRRTRAPPLVPATVHC